MQQQRRLILNSPLPTVMWQLAWPAVVAMVLYGMNNFLDGIFVGHLATIISLLRQVVFYIPVLLIAPPLYGIRSIYLASAIIDWVIFGIVIYAVIRSAKTIKNSSTTA